MKRIDAEDLNHILNHTRGLWEDLRGRNIFVTGGTGFFGCWLLESLLWVNDQLGIEIKAVVLSRSAESFASKAPHLSNHPAVRLIQGDVRSFDFPTGEFPFVIHAATEASAKLNQENPLLMFETIVDGTRRTLEFARSHGTRRFLLTSSGAVYGKQPAAMTHIPEDYTGAPDPMDPNAAYGEGKRAAEMLCRLYAHQFGIDAIVARCFAFVGPHLPLDAHYAIGNFIRDALKGGPIRVNGDGTPLRSYLYAADLAIWLWTILLRGQTCRPYNVGSDRSITIAELAGLVRQAVNPSTEIAVARRADPSQSPQRYVPSVERARDELMLENWIPLEKAIQRTVLWQTPDQYGK
ncbi:MAG: NAD-dependent epimerase/dehydratase family protein [Dehalococcoidia bacterium]|nr:NAD-dependent epimerase/dehydratase family protein [Dehalococcoidia bacterium]